MSRSLPRRLPAALLAALLAACMPLVLSGCALALGSLRKPGLTQGTVDSPRQLELAWRTPASQPSWVPADAHRIRYVAVTGGPAEETAATVRLRSDDGLPATCAEIERRSHDAFDTAWAPTVLPDRVERCGNWAVVPVPGGWFGWTPLHESERAEGD